MQLTPPTEPSPGAPDENAGGRLLLFRLRGDPYALPMSRVAGLAACGTIRKIPGAPQPILGLTEWRGNLLTVLDLPALLGRMALGGRTCLIRLADPMHEFALYLPTNVEIVPAPTDSSAQTVEVIDPVARIRELESAFRKRIAGSRDPDEPAPEGA